MRVRNEVWSLTGRECEAMATGFLIEENNLNSLDDDSRYRLRQAIGLKDEIVDCVTVRAIFNYYDDIAVEEEALVIDGKMFGSQVFKGIDPAQILGAYVFVLTAGDFPAPTSPWRSRYCSISGGRLSRRRAESVCRRFLRKMDGSARRLAPGCTGSRWNRCRILYLWWMRSRSA